MQEQNLSLNEIIKNQKIFFKAGMTKDVNYRIKVLNKLKELIKENEDEILNALYLDLGKSKAEAYMSEISPVLSEIDVMLKGVKEWSKPVKAKHNLITCTAKNMIYTEPYGTVLIISAWNYPFTLSFMPLIGALATGNTVILKQSEHSVNTSKLICKMLNDNFSSIHIYALNPDITPEELWSEKYDYIFYTGSAKVGRLVMAEAAKTLTPVSLELGGKSPCIVEKSAKLPLAAKRIIRGKLMNAGQTCIAPDYLLVDNKIKDKFISLLAEEIKNQYPDALNNDTYPKIINESQFTRLVGLIDGIKNKIGGKYDKTTGKIEPVIIPDADFSSEVMKEEIFGPILPVIGYDDIAEITEKLRTGEHPLACYVFGEKKALAQKIINEISFGGGCVNDCLLQFSNPNLPFGGVGNSGMGQYHGKYSFETFSRKKPVVYNSSVIDFKFGYAPFDEKKFELFKKIFK